MHFRIIHIQMTETGPAMKCKIVFLGDQSVGKTSIINRFIFDNFTGNEQPTVGVDFVSKTISVDSRTLRMQLWDTAGQQRFHSLIPSYIKDSHAAIIVYDITNEASFANINHWVEDVKEVRGEEATIFIIGNKSDLESQRKVATAEVDKKVEEMAIGSAVVSAKTGAGIKDFFKTLAQTIAGSSKKSGEPQRQQREPQKKVSGGQQLHNPSSQDNEPKKRKGCC